MWVLLGAVGLVLLIACADVASLVLARATVRAREMALRAALGAGRLRLVRQLVLESLLLAAAGGIGGFLLAWWATFALTAYAAHNIPRADEIHIDAHVLWYTLGIGLLTVFICGIVPAMRSSRVDVSDALKDSSRTTEGRSRHLTRGLLVAAEVAVAFTLVMGAGLLGQNFLRLTGVNPGFDPHHVLTLRTYVYGERHRKPEAELNYYAQAMDRIRALPGIYLGSGEFGCNDFAQRWHWQSRPSRASDRPNRASRTKSLRRQRWAEKVAGTTSTPTPPDGDSIFLAARRAKCRRPKRQPLSRRFRHG
jgi:putative ABC transport system permease protein